MTISQLNLDRVQTCESVKGKDLRYDSCTCLGMSPAERLINVIRMNTIKAEAIKSKWNASERGENNPINRMMQASGIMVAKDDPINQRQSVLFATPICLNTLDCSNRK